MARQNNMQYWEVLLLNSFTVTVTLRGGLVSFMMEHIPESWSHSNNTWLPSSGQGGLHSHVKTEFIK